MISQSFIQDLLNRIDIVDIIDQSVPLKKAGNNYVACCPFHKEKTPSVSVSQSKQFYHCFGCGKHGNAVNFLMEYSGKSFIEAVENLAAQVGLQMPNHSAFSVIGDRQNSELSVLVDDQMIIEKKKDSQNIQRMIDQLQDVADYYREQLRSSTYAISYLKKRGLSGEIAARFKIGYAPHGPRNLSKVFNDYDQDESINLLLKNGLIIKNSQGKYYDRFRDRIVFPIQNQKDRLS